MSRSLMAGGRVLIAISIMLGVGWVSASPAQAANLGYGLLLGRTMQKGDYLHRKSPYLDYAVELIMQNDGNLVLKRTNGHICWAAGSNPSGHRAVYQGDGNFVVYSSSNRAVWASNTVGVAGETVSIESDGDLWVGYREIATC